MNIASSSASLSTPRKNNNDRIAKTLLFAEETETATTTTNVQPSESNNNNQLFDAATMADATDALNSVGWSGVAPMQGDGEMTSDDPFVKQIDESIRGEMGVGLDELLNPAKVRSILERSDAALLFLYILSDQHFDVHASIWRNDIDLFLLYFLTNI